MSYIESGKSNPFSEIEDVDDSTFLNHPRQGQSGYVLNNGSSANVWEDKRRQLLEDRRKIEEETLQSSKRTLGLLYETEKVGLSTAEELLHQREQLQNVDEKLDSINSIMRVSQKHITSMKSIFGGVKNYFSKNADSSSAAVNGKRIPLSTSESKLHNTVESIRTVSDNAAQHNHPALRNRAPNPFGDEEKGVTPSSKVSNSTSAYDLNSRKVDQELDQNLEEVGMGISRLKELAMGLGNEIDSQNQLLDNLATKSERAGDTITNQNRQMKRILKS